MFGVDSESEDDSFDLEPVTVQFVPNQRSVFHKSSKKPKRKKFTKDEKQLAINMHNIDVLIESKNWKAGAFKILKVKRFCFAFFEDFLLALRLIFFSNFASQAVIEALFLSLIPSNLHPSNKQQEEEFSKLQLIQLLRWFNREFSISDMFDLICCC